MHFKAGNTIVETHDTPLKTLGLVRSLFLARGQWLLALDQVPLAIDFIDPVNEVGVIASAGYHAADADFVFPWLTLWHASQTRAVQPCSSSKRKLYGCGSGCVSRAI